MKQHQYTENGEEEMLGDLKDVRTSRETRNKP